jgi:hypothetical protein
MLFKFTGRYTNGRSSITVFGVTFDGNEPANVLDEAAIARLSQNIEFEAVDALDHDGDGKKGGSLPVDEDVKALRAQYRELTGKKPFHGWDAVALREKLGG